MSYNLPDGVTDAMIDEQFSGTARCECGHDADEHNEDGLTDDPQFLLNALRKIETVFRHTDARGKISNILDETLDVCTSLHCTCRKFEPAGPREDDRY
jgi:hypothetical protein